MNKENFKINESFKIKQFDAKEIAINTDIYHKSFHSSDSSDIDINPKILINEHDEYKEISKEIETFLEKNEHENYKDDDDNEFCTESNLLNKNSMYEMDNRIWKFNGKESKYEKSSDQQRERVFENQEVENKEIFGFLSKNLHKCEANLDSPIGHYDAILNEKREKCFSIDNIEFLNDLNFVNFSHPSYLFNNVTQEKASTIEKQTFMKEDLDENYSNQIEKVTENSSKKDPIKDTNYDLNLNIDNENLDDYINGRNFDNFDVCFNKKDTPYEKNKFNIPIKNKNNIFSNNNNTKDKNHLSYLSNLKDKSTHDDSNNLMRSISNGNTDKTDKLSFNEMKAFSLYENDELGVKDLTNVSAENSNNEKLIVERNFALKNNFHFKVSNSIKNKDYIASPEFFPNNFKFKNSNNKIHSPNNSSRSPNSNCNSFDNGQEKYFTDKSLPDISKIDLNESNKSMKNILITPNSVANANPFGYENLIENGNDKIKDDEYFIDHETKQRKESVLSNISNSSTSQTNPKSHITKYCLKNTTPFIPSNLKAEHQMRMNYFKNDNFNYFQNYTNYQYNNSFHNHNSQSAQPIYNYNPNFLNYDLNFVKVNSSPVFYGNEFQENFEEMKNINLSEKDNVKSDSNANTPKINTNSIDKQSNNDNATNSFKLNHVLNNKTGNPIGLGKQFNTVREREGKPRMNKGNPSEEPYNKIILENILRGKDKRTTLMIRHIPNKYNIQTILEDINQEFKGKYDLFYLPLDYYNNCNLGFAFINFVDAYHILYFFDMFRGKKWKRFNSEKICELAYAKFQGKKELIAHFEKGSIMHFEAEDKKPLILPTPNPLPKIELPIKFYDAFLALYPYSSYDICKEKFVVNNFYGF